jgi:hypothetical protein
VVVVVVQAGSNKAAVTAVHRSRVRQPAQQLAAGLRPSRQPLPMPLLVLLVAST